MSKHLLAGLAAVCACAGNVEHELPQPISSDSNGRCLESPHVAKVKAVVYNPWFPSAGKTLRDYMQWPNDPDVLLPQIASHLTEASHGLVQYQIVSTDHFNEFPPLMDGFRYDEWGYRSVVANPATHHTPETADYAYVVNQLGGCAALAQHNITEIWVYGFDWGGFDELAMKMPGDAVTPHTNPWFYRPYNIPDCGRTLWVMGFNMAVGEDNALHSYGHRAESVLSLTVGRGKWYDADDASNPWRLFSLTDKDYPGQSGVGSVHEPANAQAGYDYTNPRQVFSSASDWSSYPNLTGARTWVSCSDWGCNQLGYQQWYLSHMPHAPGSDSWGCNSWWTYIADYDRTLAPVGGPEPDNDPLCDSIGTGLTCYGSPAPGALACRQSASSTTSIYCLPPTPPCDWYGTGLTCFGGPTPNALACKQNPTSAPIYCVPSATGPLCDVIGTGLTCYGSPVQGAYKCIQNAGSTTPIYCLP
jgi:hypothetical protein